MNSVDCEFDDEAEIKRVEQLMLSSNVQVRTPTSLKRTNSDRKYTQLCSNIISHCEHIIIADMKKDKVSFKVNKRQFNMSPF